MSRARIIVGDCRESMAALEDDSVDAVVCDPPYELGFMGRKWDASGIAYDLEVWREALRVLKPGGHLLAFSGSRTYHRMACAIEDAGFDVRDQIMWLYGSGFPKSHDVSKAIDKAAGAEREVVGKKGGRYASPKQDFRSGTFVHGPDKVAMFDEITAPATDDARRWQGWGTALKPAHEPICMARKPLVGTVAANVLRYGTGAMNIDGCRVPGGEGYAEEVARNVAAFARVQEQTPGWKNSSPYKPNVEGALLGRWPANVLHDGSDEATEGLRDAARYFYTAKASGEDRDEMIGDVPKNVHPTVKPTDLMRYLVRMVTPPGGLVLDPFTGSGSTGRAACSKGCASSGASSRPSTPRSRGRAFASRSVPSSLMR